MTDPINEQLDECEELLRRFEKGDRGALEQLLDKHRQYLRQFLKLRMDYSLRSRVDVSDIVQETEFEAFCRIGDFLQRRPMPFRLWLRKTAYERLLKIREKHVKAAKRSVAREIPLAEQSSLMLAHRLFAGGSSPSEKLAKRETAERVRLALGKLAEQDREILIMRYVEKLSNQEAGYILGIDPAAVSKRHGRALLRLQKAVVSIGLRESDIEL